MDSSISYFTDSSVSVSRCLLLALFVSFLFFTIRFPYLWGFPIQKPLLKNLKVSALHCRHNICNAFCWIVNYLEGGGDLNSQTIVGNVSLEVYVLTLNLPYTHTSFILITTLSADVQESNFLDIQKWKQFTLKVHILLLLNLFFFSIQKNSFKNIKSQSIDLLDKSCAV